MNVTVTEKAKNHVLKKSPDSPEVTVAIVQVKSG